jgi:hypothetical protein
MNELLALKCLCLVRVAAEAHIVPFCQEKLWKLALVCIVTGTAASNGHRTVDNVAAGNGFVVAPEAQRASGSAELEFVGGLMRVVALGAFPFLHRRMNDLLSGHRFVARAAKRGDTGYRFEGMLAGRCMTGSAVAHRHGSMNKFILPHGSMTFCGYTGLLRVFSRGKGAAIMTEHQKQEQENRKKFRNYKFFLHRIKSSFNKTLSLRCIPNMLLVFIRFMNLLHEYQISPA